MLVDSHCHLEGSKYDSDRTQVLQRAAAAEIEALLCIGNGTGPGTYDCGIALAVEFGSCDSAPGRLATPQIYTSVGIHPHEAKVADDAAFFELQSLAQHPKVIAWGEIGLDYWYDLSPRELQRSVFVRQMELARVAEKPIILHCRGSQSAPDDAWNDMLRLLQLHWAGSGLGGILHCFTGRLQFMQDALDMGFLISFAGNVTLPKAEDIREAARQVPPDCMLIETDSPYLTPIPYRGRRNEPAYVVEVARCIGNLRQLPIEQVAALTTANFYRCFRLRA
jgi:TatD DNase family protein